MKTLIFLIGGLFYTSCSGCVSAPVVGEENTSITPVPITEPTERPISQVPDSSKPVSSTPNSSKVVPPAIPKQPVLPSPSTPSQGVLVEPSQPDSPPVSSKPEQIPSVPECSLTQNDSSTKEESVKEVFVKGHLLQFVKIDSGNIENMALSEEQATFFYRKALQMLPPNSTPVPPFIFKAVSDETKFRTVPIFWIQVAPVEPELYGEIVPFKSGSDNEMVRDGSLYKISYQNARDFMEELNKLCEGKAKFDLPTEKQFVYLAKKIYDPVKDYQENKKALLKPCHELSNLEISGVKYLLGYRWQLTKSKCEQFGDSSDPTRECNNRMYVKKGGTATSKNANECMPEYRAEASPRIRQPNTTFRLILQK